MEPRPLPASVLIVDELPDSYEVLRTVFEPRGVSILEATEAQQGLEVMRRCQPDVVVLDVDADAIDEDFLRNFERETREGGSSLVILGKTRRPDGFPAGRVFSKPYHYSPLIRTIEQLLEQ